METIYHIVSATIFLRFVFLGVGQYYKIRSGKAEEYKPDSSMAWSDTNYNWNFRMRVSDGFWGCSEIPELMAGRALLTLLLWFIFTLAIIYNQ